MIYRCLCKCPNNHVIEVMLLPCDTDVAPEKEESICETAATLLKFRMELWILNGALGDSCEICYAPAKTFKFNVDKLDRPTTPEIINSIQAQFAPELMKQRALRHARKGAN